MKWGEPIYTHHGNVVGIREFKEHVALWFFEGTILNNPLTVLVVASDTTQALRQWRFKKGDAMPFDGSREYIAEATQNQEMGFGHPLRGPGPLCYQLR